MKEALSSEFFENILAQKGLRKTKVRLRLLQELQKTTKAQSYHDLKKLFKKADKSTIYRNLSALVDAGVIHSINDHTGIAKYAMGPVQGNGSGHAHFVCEKCQTVYCVNENAKLEIQVPDGFRPKIIETIIKGTCPNC